MEEIEKKIVNIIDNLRPYLVSDGGNIEFIKYEDNIVYVKMQGACANCEMIDLTLKDGIMMEYYYLMMNISISLCHPLICL